MQIEIININNIPENKKLKSLLGDEVYEFHKLLSGIIVDKLNPDIEIWDDGGRRGKYFHGYRINKIKLIINLYLLCVNGEGLLKCELELSKLIVNKLLQNKDKFSASTQKNLQSIISNKKEHGSYFLEIRISNSDTFEDMQYLIELLAVG